jgi:hypothetical protein
MVTRLHSPRTASIPRSRNYRKPITVNGYHGRLKEWLRPFHGVATEYLDHYLGWRRIVEAFGDDASHQRWLQAAQGIRVYP